MASTSENFVRQEKPAGPNGDPVNVTPLMARLAGAALIASATGLWLIPGADWSAGLLLMKLGMTSFFAVAGGLFLTVGRRA